MKKVFIFSILAVLLLPSVGVVSAAFGGNCSGGIEIGNGQCASYSTIVSNITFCENQDLGTTGVQVRFTNASAPQCVAIAGSGQLSLLNVDEYPQFSCNYLGLIGPAGGIGCLNEHESAFAWNVKSNGGRPPQGVIDLLTGETEPDEGDEIDVEPVEVVPGETIDEDEDTPQLNEDFQGSEDEPEAREYISLGLAERVDGFYTWALGMGAVLALAIIIYGGVLYSASAGNPSRIEEAKTWIQHALFGLGILLSAFLILNTINPDLTRLEEIFVLENPTVEAPGLPAGIGLDICHDPRNEVSAASYVPGRQQCPFGNASPMFTDSWCQYRDQTKYHAGTDMFILDNPTQATLVAIENGVIFRAFCTDDWREKNAIGGITVHLEGDSSGNQYYYGHMDRCAKQWQVGDRVIRGEILGYVGDTGNAKGTPHHLHIGIRPEGSDRNAFKKTDLINPYPLMKLLCTGPPDGCREDCFDGEWGDARWYCARFQQCNPPSRPGGDRPQQAI